MESQEKEIQSEFSIDQKSQLDEDKIKQLYESLEKLKKFVSQTQNIFVQQQDNVQSYFSKFEMNKDSVNLKESNQTIIQIVKKRIQKMVKRQRIKKNWGSDDTKVLNWIVINWSRFKCYKNVQKQFTTQDWQYISSLIPGSNANSSMFKWLSLHVAKLNQSDWNKQESDLLKKIIEKYTNFSKKIPWKKVSKELYLNNINTSKNYRNPKQCKEHWICRLNPSLKRQPWSPEEDILLLKQVKQNFGLKKWRQIARFFEGRTQNAIKNRYSLIIQKQKKFGQKSQDKELQLVERYLERCYRQKFIKIIEPDSEQQNSQIKEQKSIKNNKISKQEQKWQLSSVNGSQNNRNIQKIVSLSD